jgi:sugar O-acyltransferase (sialic acid O-acetyltransferase NeuD family)
MSAPLDITVRPDSVAILGFHDGNAGQVETWFEATTGLHLACFVHPEAEPPQMDAAAENRRRVSQRTNFPTRDSFKGRPLLSAVDWPERLLALGIRRVVPLLSNNRERLRAIAAARAHGLELVSAIHPSVLVLSGATIEPGVWINAGSIIGYNAELAAGVLINTGVQLDHHNVLESCCQVDPGVVAAGNVTLRECCHVHTGATIINRIEIGTGAVVGAGAVVIAAVPPRCTVVGVPARIIKQPASS